MNHIVENSFFEGFSNRLYFTNASYTYITRRGEEKTSRNIYFRIPRHPFIDDNLPDGTTLLFKGYIKEGYFAIDSIVLTSDYEGAKSFEREINVNIYYKEFRSDRDSKFLNNLIDKTESALLILEDKLQSWNDYIRWERGLIEKRSVGIKYVNAKYDETQKYLVFTTILPSKEYFNRLRKYFRKYTLMVYDNNYSQDSLLFKLREKIRSRKNAIPLGKFIKVLKEQDISKKEIEKYLSVNNNKDNDTENNNIENSTEINENFYIMEIAFDVDDRYLKNDDNEDIAKADLKEYIENTFLKDINKDGFIGTSHVGQLALLRRYQDAIDSFATNETLAPNLALWLFDITKAREVNVNYDEKINWLNKNIENNENQNIAVRKMLATEDVCLIQGPPGTGKTTVIAEAVYQFVRRGERVLIASQSNLAVSVWHMSLVYVLYV